MTTTTRTIAPGEVLPLSRKLDVRPDPVELLRRATQAHDDPGVVLLESADFTTRAGVRSLLVTRSAVRARCNGRAVTLDALTPNGLAALDALLAPLGERALDLSRPKEDRLVATYPAPPSNADDTARQLAASPADALRALAHSWTLLTEPVRPTLLLAGVFAYDFIDAYEDLPEPASDPLGAPDFVFFLPEELIVLDHERRCAHAITYVFGGASSGRIYHDMTRRVADLAELCRDTPERTAPPQTAPPSSVSQEVTCDARDEDYAAGVTHLKEHIAAGDVFQIVPSRTFCAPCDDPISAYARLRALNPSPYMFFVRDEVHTLFGASPETSVKVTGRTPQERTVEITPIAGTRRRGVGADGAVDVDLDGRIEAELRADTKEQAEHMMLVDLARNDVARVSVPGTRHVTRLLDIARYKHVMHLVSHVQGQLRPDFDALHAYVASMNMGTLVGAPKIEAARLLRGVEATRRGFYGGAVGYLTHAGELDTAIVIRSAVVFEGRAFVRAGAGVVHDSVPALEADETRRKAHSVLLALTPPRPEGGLP
ncbi:MAG: anthranilate synthase component 1 [Myxococcota bacterium]